MIVIILWSPIKKGRGNSAVINVNKFETPLEMVEHCNYV